MHSTVRGRARASGIISLLKIVPCAHKTPTELQLVWCGCERAAPSSRSQLKRDFVKKQHAAAAARCTWLGEKRQARGTIHFLSGWLPPNHAEVMFSALVTLDSQLAAVNGKFITALMVKEYHEKFVPRQLLLHATLPRSWWVQRSNWANSLN